jgi:hypothetical protein
MPVKKILQKSVKKNTFRSLLMVTVATFILGFLLNHLSNKFFPSYYMEGMDNIAEGNTDKKLVYYSMNGCPHCKNFDPIWASMGSKINGVKLEKKDSSKAPSSVSGFPAILLMDSNDNVLAEFEGSRDKNGIEQFLNQHP